MADPHQNREAMNPSEPDAHGAGTGGPRPAWRIYIVLLLILFVLVLLALVWLGGSAVFGG